MKVEPKATKLDLGVTLVEETPEKSRVLSAPLSVTGGSLAFGQPKFGLTSAAAVGTGERARGGRRYGEEEEMMDCSPDVILLNPSSKERAVNDMMDDDEQEEDSEVVIMATPSKPLRGGRGRKKIR